MGKPIDPFALLDEDDRAARSAQAKRAPSADDAAPDHDDVAALVGTDMRARGVSAGHRPARDQLPPSLTPSCAWSHEGRRRRTA